MRIKKTLSSFLISSILIFVINTSVFALSPGIPANHSKLQRLKPLTMETLEKKLHDKVMHNRKKLNVDINRVKFVYRVYHLLETGLNSM